MRRNNKQIELRTVIGIHAVREAMRVSPVRRLWLRVGWKDHADLRDLEQLASAKRIRIEERAIGQLNQIAESHQGVACFVDGAPEWDWASITSNPISRLLILDGVVDPQNLGAVMRTAWLMGTKAIFIPENRAAGLSPSASKVAQGAAEHIPLVVDSLADVLAQAKELGFWAFGLSHRASNSLYETRLPEKVILVLGSEASGIRKPIERACDELVAIPQVQAEASYNVSVAAALALGESFRQHQIAEKLGK